MNTGNWSTVQYEGIQNKIHDNQLWKIDGNILRSKNNEAILGLHETIGLAAFFGTEENIDPVFIDAAAISNYEFLLPGNFSGIA